MKWFDQMFMLGAFAGAFVIPMALAYMGMATFNFPMTLLAWVTMVFAFAAVRYVMSMWNRR